MNQFLTALLGALIPILLPAQGYISYFSGDTTDVETPTSGGVVLMGGATENDNAMRWFLQRAGGGDVVVIRASGADGYNDYLFSKLGVPVNSVQSIVTPSLSAANLPYVARQIRNAEALWIAGGDQWRYLSYWKNGPVAEALDFLIHTKKAVVGGTSAGMAVLGEACFSAQNGTVTSEEALSDPYGEKVTVEYGDFIHVPFLDHLITDTHYDGRNRYGRHVAFLARLATDHQQPFRGIASEEYTAVCIDTTGLARVFGGYPEAEDYAYFIQPNCNQPIFPEHCMPGKPLNWVRHEHALTVCKVAGKQDGSDTFQLTDWKTAPGSTWERWWVEHGVLKKAVLHKLPECVLDKH